MSVRSDLRAQVFQIAGGRCEHPARTTRKVTTAGRVDTFGYGRCLKPAVEMAHIFPRGMGHTGYRDTLTNVMAACTGHARSTDDLTSPEWDAVPGWTVRDRDGTFNERLMTPRQALANYVNARRRREGVDLEAS